MPFNIPTLEELVKRAAGAFRANLKGSDARLYPNNVAASAKVIGGATSEAFSFLDYISRQHIKHLAEGVWLERHAYDYGLARLPPTAAEGKAVIVGDPGVVVPSGVEVQRADGFRYITTTGGVTDGDGELVVAVRALTTGAAGNATDGVLLTIAVPMSSISSEATVHEDGIGGGGDTESDEGLRQRLLFRLRYPPHGGAAHDYVAWVRSVSASITRVFVDPVTQSNDRTSVGVWFVMDGLYGNGVPQAADVELVSEYIDTVRPAGAIVEVAAPAAETVDIEIDNLTEDSVTTREAIARELRALFRRLPVSTETTPFVLYRSVVSEAISAATGEAHHTLVAPEDDTAFSTGELPVLGTIIYS